MPTIYSSDVSPSAKPTSAPSSETLCIFSIPNFWSLVGAFVLVVGSGALLYAYCRYCFQGAFLEEEANEEEPEQVMINIVNSNVGDININTGAGNLMTRSMAGDDRNEALLGNEAICVSQVQSIQNEAEVIQEDSFDEDLGRPLNLRRLKSWMAERHKSTLGVSDRYHTVELKKLSDPNMNEKTKNALLNDVRRMVDNLNSSFIVKLYGLAHDNVKGWFVLTELMLKNSLFDLMHKSSNKVELSVAISLMGDMIMGLEYLHGNSINHGDLKSSNVCLYEVNGSLVARLANYGLSKIAQEEIDIYSESHENSIKWAAPEKLQNQDLISNAIDIYAFAIIMWELVTGKIPYKNLGLAEIFNKVTSGIREDIPHNCPAKVASLISKCWKQAPEDRPQVLNARVQVTNLSSCV